MLARLAQIEKDFECYGGIQHVCTIDAIILPKSHGLEWPSQCGLLVTDQMPMSRTLIWACVDVLWLTFHTLHLQCLCSPNPLTDLAQVLAPQQSQCFSLPARRSFRFADLSIRSHATHFMAIVPYSWRSVVRTCYRVHRFHLRVELRILWY